MAGNSTTRSVDIVLCIDGTGSMSGVINNVKKNALRFNDELISHLADVGDTVAAVRVKVIVFRDYGCDTDAMEESPFFEVSGSDSELFSEWMNHVSARGGGDIPENGLEALYFAMKSDFVTGPKDRQVIVLFTDADALPLGERKGAAGYPEDMPDEDGLKDIWDCIDSQSHPEIKLREHNRRMVIFAPSDTYYKAFADTMGGVNFQPVDAGTGLDSVDFSEIIKVVAASVGV